MEQTFFNFNHRSYRQPFGTPIGSPISPCLADFVMQDMETDIFKRIEFDIPVYFRYVDDNENTFSKYQIFSKSIIQTLFL